MAKAGVRWTREAFEREAVVLLPALYRAARRLTSDATDAEDLVQETCVKAFGAFSRTDLVAPAHFRAWMFRILINGFRDRLRAARRRPGAGSRGAAAPGALEGLASPVPGPEERSAEKRFAVAAKQALAALKPEFRVVATLYLVEEMSYREIAEIVGCPVGTVMSRLARARRALREALAAHVGVGSEPASGPGAGKEGGP